MSHWKNFKNDVLTNTNEATLAAALEKLNVTLDASIKEIQNPWGREAVDMGFRNKTTGDAIALGFRRDANNTLELVGDFYGTGLREADFIDRVSQHYTVEDIVRKVNQSMWTLESEPVLDETTGEYVMQAYIYA